MSLDIVQFRVQVVRPALEAIGLWSRAAEALVIGTALQESGLIHLRQVGGGPALGLFQIEPATHRDLYRSFLPARPDIGRALDLIAAATPARELQLVTNLLYAAAICRLVYFRRPEPLPPADDVDALAAYWKAHYNTAAGKGTAAQWAMHYRGALRR